jgi:uncharacterized FAD-dependent dehydrogenase
MTKRIQFKLPFTHDVEAYLRSKYPEVVDYRIISKSLDARGAPRGKKPIFHYTLEVVKKGEQFDLQTEDLPEINGITKKPIIIGAGPAGLFSALRFSEYNVPCVVIERGDVAQKRMLHISKYWRRGILNEESNVCFGEGGAGLFSDGKLITRIKSPFVKYVMQKFVDFGAPPETAYESNPHLGSNKIRKIINQISDYLKERDFDFYYNSRVDELIYEKDKVVGVLLSSGEKLYSDHIILGAGHSAKNIYEHLHQSGVALKHKDFAVGVRVEHPRVKIDQIQHGDYWEAKELGAARYKLTHHNKESDKGTYSFCMCPGGYVLSSGTESDGIVINGMSNFARNSRWSNSALVVSVNQNKDFDTKSPLSGLNFCESIEKKAYEISMKESDGRSLPAMTITEFLSGKINLEKELPKTSCPSGLFKTDIRKIFPAFINDHLKKSLYEFDKKMPGFITEEAVLVAPETRTSAPLSIPRDKTTLESLSHQNLYPCGEGAGYAGWNYFSCR